MKLKKCLRKELFHIPPRRLWVSGSFSSSSDGVVESFFSAGTRLLSAWRRQRRQRRWKRDQRGRILWETDNERNISYSYLNVSLFYFLTFILILAIFDKNFTYVLISYLLNKNNKSPFKNENKKNALLNCDQSIKNSFFFSGSAVSLCNKRGLFQCDL